MGKIHGMPGVFKNKIRIKGDVRDIFRPHNSDDADDEAVVDIELIRLNDEVPLFIEGVDRKRPGVLRSLDLKRQVCVVAHLIDYQRRNLLMLGGD